MLVMAVFSALFVYKAVYHVLHQENVFSGTDNNSDILSEALCGECLSSLSRVMKVFGSASKSEFLVP